MGKQTQTQAENDSALSEMTRALREILFYYHRKIIDGALFLRRVW